MTGLSPEPFIREGGSWAGDHLSFPDAVPEWGGWLIPSMAVSIALVFYAVSLRQGDTGKLYVWRNYLLYLAGTVSACIFVVGLCRYFSPDYCPSDLTVYGGVLPGIGRCFPDSHAGTVFCLFALYFVFQDTYPRLVLSVVLFSGVLYTLTEMARGERFLLQSLATLVMDWFLCAVLCRLSPGRILVSKPLPLPRHQAMLVMVTVVYWLIFFNRALFGQILSQRGLGTLDILVQATGVFMLLGLGFFTVLNLVVFPKVLKAVLVVLTLTAATVNYFSLHYGVVVNSDMINNVFATDITEAGELLNFAMCMEVLFSALPLLFIIIRSPVIPQKFMKQLQWAAGLSVLSLFLGGMVLFASF